MDFIIVEGDFPFWRSFVVNEWKRLPHRTLLLTQMPKLWRHEDYDEVEDLPLREGLLDIPKLKDVAAKFGQVIRVLTPDFALRQESTRLPWLRDAI